ncbi:MAG TPA: LysM peptidoglycan-binding domain-containing protein [Candidatus Omnitrophota bacterium]|nr:LysM peptidoglycan-binding domain-containing protein [Candidatus Omnitrophota bacterium]
MPKGLIKGMVVVAMFVFMTGCSTVKKIDVRGYMQDKPRVDQDIQGAVGNWENAPMAEDPERKPTRKMYYLEFSKEADPFEEADKLLEEKSSSTTASESFPGSNEPTQKTQPQQRTLDLSGLKDTPTQPSVPAAAGEYTEYKVEKDDTLQKISMKFYNTHSKWPKIYEANKDLIPNPNFIKPGIVIRIPKE